MSEPERQPQLRPIVGIRDCGLFWFLIWPRSFKYRIGAQERSATPRGYLSKELADILCCDPTILPLVGVYNRTVTAVYFFSVVGGAILGLFVPKAFGLRMFLAEMYPDASAFILVLGMLSLGTGLLMFSDLYRSLKRMIDLYNDSAIGDETSAN